MPIITLTSNYLPLSPNPTFQKSPQGSRPLLSGGITTQKMQVPPLWSLWRMLQASLLAMLLFYIPPVISVDVSQGGYSRLFTCPGKDRILVTNFLLPFSI